MIKLKSALIYMASTFLMNFWCRGVCWNLWVLHSLFFFFFAVVVVVVCLHMRLLYAQLYFIGSFTYCVFASFYIYCFASKWCATFFPPLFMLFCSFSHLFFLYFCRCRSSRFHFIFSSAFAMCRCALIKLRTQIM